MPSLRIPATILLGGSLVGLQLVFIGFKMTGVIDWNWWLVFWPLGGLMTLYVSFFFFLIYAHSSDPRGRP